MRLKGMVADDMTLVRYAVLVLVVCALSGLSDTPRTPSEEAYILSEMWETYGSLVRQRERLLREHERLSLEERCAFSDSLYVVLDLRARRIFLKIHGLMLRDISLLSLDVEGRPTEGERVREFVSVGRTGRLQEGPSEASADSGSVPSAAKQSFWDLPFEPGLVIRVAVREPSSRSGGITRLLGDLGRWIMRAVEAILPSGRPAEADRIRVRMRPEDAGTILNSVPRGTRLIVVP